MAATDPATVPARDEAEPAPRRRRRRRRTVLIWALIVVASLIAFASILTTWVNRQVFDNESWKQASADLIEDQQVRDAVSVFVVDQLYENVDVAAELDARLPENLDALAAPLAGALREPATTTIGRLLAEPRVQELWINANAVAQQKLVNVLENTTGHGISTGEGVVTLDLGALVTEVGTELGLPESALARIPPDAGVITRHALGPARRRPGGRPGGPDPQRLAVGPRTRLVRACDLPRARRATADDPQHRVRVRARRARGARRAPGRGRCGHRGADRAAGRRRRQAGVAARQRDPGADRVGGGALRRLRDHGRRPRRADEGCVAVRRWVAPVLNERPGIAWASVGAVFLLLVLWGGTHALRTWWGILLLGTLLVIGVLALRRQTLREFPAGSAHAGAPPSPLRRVWRPRTDRPP